MEIEFSNRTLERLCTDEREMARQRADVADKLKMRMNALREASDVADLQRIDPGGRWHELTADRSGDWAGRLSRNWRLIVVPEGAGSVDQRRKVLVVGLDDYH